MKAQVYYLRFQAPVTGLPRAPALFGHLAWMERWRSGEAGLRNLLESFRENPPFLLSSAFPVARGQGKRLPLLPRPKLPPVLERDSRKRKALKRIRYLPFDLFRRVAEEGDMVLAEALEGAAHVLDGAALVPSGYHVELAEEVRTRVGIARATGTHAPGVLFSDAALRVAEAVVYVTFTSDSFGPQWFEARLREIGLSGFGGKKSIGYGAFGVENGGEVELPEASEASAYTMLSPALPLDVEGWYSVEPYWGRLGEHYAFAENPFKRVYYRAVEGSTFRKRPTGTLLEVTPKPPPEEEVRVYEYLYPFALGVRA